MVYSLDEDLAGDKKKKEDLIEKLYIQIGQKKVEIDWLKKNCCKDIATAPGYD